MAFPSYPELWRWIFPRVFFLFKLKELLCQNLSVLQKVCKVPSSLFSANENLYFICQPALQEKQYSGSLQSQLQDWLLL